MPYRNVKPTIADQGVLVDEQSLWELDKSNNRMVLIDQDQYLTAPIDHHLFKLEN